MSAHVHVDAVTLRYGRSVTALDDVSLEFAPGVIHGLLGRNGSGKTSLLSVIAGFRKPTSGEVRIDRQPVFECSEAMAKVALIRGPGDTVDHDWPVDRCSDALKVAGELRPDWDADYAERLVASFNIPVRKRLGQLSRGQRAALGVVLGLASRAPLTIFDETYLALDAPSRYMFYDELLADVVAHPRTVIVSTHLIEEVAGLFGHVTIIDEGRTMLQQDADALRDHGMTVTGPSERVKAFTDGHVVLASRQLGPTRQVTIARAYDDAVRRDAQRDGLDVGPIGLQDLFIHLTASERNTT